MGLLQRDPHGRRDQGAAGGHARHPAPRRRQAARRRQLQSAYADRLPHLRSATPASPSTRRSSSGGCGRALALRERLFAEPYYRLVHAEADGLPGLVCDRFGDVLVMQVNTAGMQALSPALLAAARRGCWRRGDRAAQRLAGARVEGLDRRRGASRSGTIDGPVAVRENGLAFFADVLDGQKTGWFYDQRDSRAFVAPLAAAARCSTSTATPAASPLPPRRRAPLPLLGIDSSEPALALARRAAAANGVAGRCTFRRAEVFGELERLGRLGRALSSRGRRPAGVRQVEEGPRQRPARLSQAGAAGGGAGRAAAASCSSRRARTTSSRRRCSARWCAALAAAGRVRPHPPRGKGGGRPSGAPASAGDRLSEVGAAATRLTSYGRHCSCVDCCRCDRKGGLPHCRSQLFPRSWQRAQEQSELRAANRLPGLRRDPLPAATTRVALIATTVAIHGATRSRSPHVAQYVVRYGREAI